MSKLKTLRAFSFFEVLIYMGIFSLIATGLLAFAWDVLHLSEQDRAARQVYSEARVTSERLKYLIRNSAGIDVPASRMSDADGKLVLNQLGSSGTLTIDLDGGRIRLSESGQGEVKLTSANVRVTDLTFLDYGSAADASEFVSFSLTLESPSETRPTAAAATTIESGAFIRNSGVVPPGN